MKTTTVNITGEIVLSYDENSNEFKEALEGYNECIGSGDKNEVLKHVAFHVTRFGIDSMVEGVGYVALVGKTPEWSPDSGIRVGTDYDEFNFEIE